MMMIMNEVRKGFRDIYVSLPVWHFPRPILNIVCCSDDGSMWQYDTDCKTRCHEI